MNRQAGQDMVLAAILAALSLFVLVHMGSEAGTNIVRGGEVTHASLPMIYAGLLLFLSLLLGAKALVSIRRPNTKDSAFSLERAVWLRISGTLALLTAYVALLKSAVPFVVLTAAFLALLFLLYGHRSLLHVGLVAGIGSVALYTLFIRILHLPI